MLGRFCIPDMSKLPVEIETSEIEAMMDRFSLDDM